MASTTGRVGVGGGGGALRLSKALAGGGAKGTKKKGPSSVDGLRGGVTFFFRFSCVLLCVCVLCFLCCSFWFCACNFSFCIFLYFIFFLHPPADGE